MDLFCIVNPIALRMAKNLWSFGISACNRCNRIKDNRSIEGAATLFSLCKDLGISLLHEKKA